jgi:hypothetical protein
MNLDALLNHFGLASYPFGRAVPEVGLLRHRSFVSLRKGCVTRLRSRGRDPIPGPATVDRLAAGLKARDCSSGWVGVVGVVGVQI